MSATLEMIRAGAARHGLNLVAALPIERYDRAVTAAWRAAPAAPWARSIVVIGNGGGAFWKAYRIRVEADPAWAARDNPLDDFTREVVERELLEPLSRQGARCAVVYPFTQAAPGLNFIELGKLAGLGGPSLVGVLVHPAYGPWVAFRAALLLEEALDAPGEALGFDPCPSCTARSCIGACPVGAVTFPAGWDVPRCLEHRVEVEPDCAPRCHARVGCVLGPEHRYPDDALAYHQARALRVMRPYYLSRVKSSCPS